MQFKSETTCRLRGMWIVRIRNFPVPLAISSAAFEITIFDITVLKYIYKLCSYKKNDKNYNNGSWAAVFPWAQGGMSPSLKIVMTTFSKCFQPFFFQRVSEGLQELFSLCFNIWCYPPVWIKIMWKKDFIDCLVNIFWKRVANSGAGRERYMFHILL